MEMLIMVELIPRRVIFGNPGIYNVNFSPNGRYIAYLASKDGVLNICMSEINNLEKVRILTFEKKRGIQNFSWAYTNEDILFMKDNYGDENWRVYVVNINTLEVRDLTPGKDIQNIIKKLSPNFPEDVLIERKSHEGHALYCLNIKTGKTEMVFDNTRNFGRLIVDQDFNVKLGINYYSDGGAGIFQNENGHFELFLNLDAEDAIATRPICFDHKGRYLFLYDSRGRDAVCLSRIDLQTKELRVLAQHEKSDIIDTVIHPITKHIQVALYYIDRIKYIFIDDEIDRHFQFLQNKLDGDLNISNRSIDDKKWIIYNSKDNSPPHYYYYNTENQEIKYLFSISKELEDKPLTSMHSVTIKSRDGLELQCYYSLPLESDPENSGKPGEPLPTVLFVHGGPWAREYWGCNAFHQWLCNRGYVVLSVNFRGSTGFGKKFLNAGNLQWSGKMQDDLIDAINWAIQERISREDSIAIMGQSYGGYASLVGLSFTPEIFACGIDMFGPTDLITFMESVHETMGTYALIYRKRVGDHTTPGSRKKLAESSPINKVHDIVKPLLVGQGANDPRVKIEQSNKLVRALEKRNVSVYYVIYHDEGHGFSKQENRVAFYAVAEAFLAKYLGGKLEPPKHDLEKAQMEFKMSGEELPFS
jgi:dipeptidyl aminopeptidase/acylaminoacyl peptidase